MKDPCFFLQNYFGRPPGDIKFAAHSCGGFVLLIRAACDDLDCVVG
jgi:hypothetical protein